MTLNEQEDEAEKATATAVSFHRRGLLRAAAGGLTLAASGLFLPAWLEETEARGGALDGAAGGRRGKDRRGRHRKRKHGDRKDPGKEPSGAPPRGSDANIRTVALRVANLSVKPLDCTFYYRIKSGLDDYSAPVFHHSDTITSISALRYDPDRYRVGVLIKQALGPADLYVDVRNVSYWFPRGGVWQGTHLDPPGGNVGAALIREQDFAQDEEHQEQNVVLKRLNDDSNGTHRIEWVLTIY